MATQEARVRIAILGASGYTGAELLRILAHHPRAEIVALTADRQVGKRTLGVILGRGGTRVEYAGCVGVAYAVAIGLGVTGMVGAWWWLPLLSLPLGLWLVRFVSRTEGRPLNQALKRTGQLHLLFGVLFALALWLG